MNKQAQAKQTKILIFRGDKAAKIISVNPYLFLSGCGAVIWAILMVVQSVESTKKEKC